MIRPESASDKTSGLVKNCLPEIKRRAGSAGLRLARSLVRPSSTVLASPVGPTVTVSSAAVRDAQNKIMAPTHFAFMVKRRRVGASCSLGNNQFWLNERVGAMAANYKRRRRRRASARDRNGCGSEWEHSS